MMRCSRDSRRTDPMSDTTADVEGRKPHAPARSASLLERRGFELPVVFALPLFRERSCRKEISARWFPKNRTEKFLRRDPSVWPRQNEAPESNCSPARLVAGWHNTFLAAWPAFSTSPDNAGEGPWKTNSGPRPERAQHQSIRLHTRVNWGFLGSVQHRSIPC
jgi:hypothetical protein